MVKTVSAGLKFKSKDVGLRDDPLPINTTSNWKKSLFI